MTFSADFPIDFACRNHMTGMLQSSQGWVVHATCSIVSQLQTVAEPVNNANDLLGFLNQLAALEYSLPLEVFCV